VEGEGSQIGRGRGRSERRKAKTVGSAEGEGSQIGRRRTIVAKQNPESSLDLDSEVEVTLKCVEVELK
jgi:hypothetical protein